MIPLPFKVIQMEANKALPKAIEELRKQFDLDLNGLPKECWTCAKMLQDANREFGFCNTIHKDWLLNDLRQTQLFKNYQIYLKALEA